MKNLEEKIRLGIHYALDGLSERETNRTVKSIYTLIVPIIKQEKKKAVEEFAEKIIPDYMPEKKDSYYGLRKEFNMWRKDFKQEIQDKISKELKQ